MMETGKNVDGFQFNSDIEISKALEDKRKIDRLKEKIDFDDIDAAIALYNKIVERSFFESVVGYSFLHELSNQIRDKKKCKLKPIPVQNEDIKTNLIIKTDVYAEKMKKLKEDNEKQNMKIRKMTITIVALLAIVVGMIFIMATNDNVGYFNAEEKVLNKYSAWEERLSNWENELNERENGLNY